MTELVITCPGQPEQVVSVGDAPITIGRGEDCTAFIAEKKASRNHLTVRRNRAGVLIAEDRDSSNGTWFVEAGGDQRFLRRVVEEGDELRIGETRIRVRATTAAAADAPPPVVSGTLQLTPATGELPKAPEPEPAPVLVAEERPRRGGGDDEWDERPDRAGQKRAMVRGLALLGGALAVLVGVELYFGRKADQKSVRKEAHLEALRILEDVGKGSQHMQERRDAFALKYPRAPELLTLDRYLDRVRQREEFVRAKRDALNHLQGQLYLADRGDMRMRLLQLMRELPDEPDYVRDVERMLDNLDRRKAEEDLDALRGLERRVEALRAEKSFAAADRLLRSFEDTHDSMGAAPKERFDALRTRVTADLKKAAGDLWKQVGEEQDPLKQRALLAGAWPSLAGTKDGERIAEKLRSAASLAAPRMGTPSRPGQPTRPGTQPGAAPTVPTVMDKLLARAKQAEAMLARREWAGGRALLALLAEESEGGRLQSEWKQRLGEVDAMLGLVRSLGESTGAERKPRRKLSSGSWKVIAANPTEVTLESRKGASVHRWSEMPAQDVLTLLTPARIADEQRHAVAILAANLGERQAFVNALLPIFEKGGDLTASNALVARHLYGRSTPPEGGYRAYKGELLDRAGYDRRLTQERIAFLRQDAGRVLAKLAKDAAFKKLQKLKDLRKELDTRRAYALRAIFNTTHYPYPYSKGSQNYQAVQKEIDRRTARVQEIWDDPIKVRIKRDGPLAKQMDAWDLIIAELQAKKVDTEDLEARIRPYALYVTGDPIGIRDFYKSAGEREWQAYNRWVMESYNPARTEYARESERKQVRVTNEYRMMIGYTAVVTPGSAPYASITKDNVIQILDQGRVDKLSPLRALRIDNRLVEAARLHSEDMSMRGYFAHQAPPNPATGKGSTGPADRMMALGYRGFGYSENIAMSASPTKAHFMWIHSSGHHRNILSGWTDLGSGVGGRNFTQNFGSGGGARPEIQPDTKIRDREGARRGGSRPRREQ
ncbi:MAG: FHA domain-containing protein [Planctomycetota bacterium]|nr:FHA domain-containing protein [Planctomycetota bacterium]